MSSESVLFTAKRTERVISEATRAVLKKWMIASDEEFAPAFAELIRLPEFKGNRELAVPAFADSKVHPVCVDPRSSDFWLVDMLTGELFSCTIDPVWSFDEMIESGVVFTRKGDTFELSGLTPKHKHADGCCGMPRPGGVGNNQMLHPIHDYLMCIACMGRLRPGQFNICDACSK